MQKGDCPMKNAPKSRPLGEEIQIATSTLFFLLFFGPIALYLILWPSFFLLSIIQSIIHL